MEGEYDKLKYSNVQLEYVGNLSKLKLLERRMKQYDMLLPFIIPKLIDRYNPVINSPVNAPQWITKESSLTIFEFCTCFTLDDIRLYQVDSYEYSNENEDIISCEWVMELITNSCNSELNTHIEETFGSLEEMGQGGITFFKIALDEIFVMSNSVILGLYKYLENFVRDGLSNTRGGNISKITEHPMDVSKRLFETKGFHVKLHIMFEMSDEVYCT